MIYFVHNTDNLKKRFKPRPAPPKLTHPPPAPAARRLLSVPAACTRRLPPTAYSCRPLPAACRLSLGTAVRRAPTIFSAAGKKKAPLQRRRQTGHCKKGFLYIRVLRHTALRVQLQVGIRRVVHYPLFGIRIDETEFPYIGTQIRIIRIQFGAFGQILHAL